MAKKYLLIGKSNAMRPVMIKDSEGRFHTIQMRRGIRREISEEEMTFHVWRQASKSINIIQVVEQEA